MFEETDGVTEQPESRFNMELRSQNNKEQLCVSLTAVFYWLWRHDSFWQFCFTSYWFLSGFGGVAKEDPDAELQNQKGLFQKPQGKNRKRGWAGYQKS